MITIISGLAGHSNPFECCIVTNWQIGSMDVLLEFAGDAEQTMPKAYSIWEQKLSKIHDLSAGSFVGLAIGDALGAPVEFCGRGTFPKVTEYRSGGKFDLPAGAWTDDTAMSLCLAQSLVTKEGFDAKDLLERFSKWLEFGENTSTGISVGVGQNTLRTLGAFRRNGTLAAEKIGSKNDGNGSLMRLSCCCNIRKKLARIRAEFSEFAVENYSCFRHR